MSRLPAAVAAVVLVAAAGALLATATRAQPQSNPYANRTFVPLGTSADGGSGRSSAWFIEPSAGKVFHCAIATAAAPSCTSTSIP